MSNRSRKWPMSHNGFEGSSVFPDERVTADRCAISAASKKLRTLLSFICPQGL
jgi:hypothetical protein